MATQPVVPEIQSELAALAKHHVNVSYALIAVIVVVLALCGLGGYVGLKFADAQLARAEKSEVAYNDASKRLTDLLATDQAQRLADAQQIASLMSGIAKRDAQPLPKQVQSALAPDASATVVAAGLAIAYEPIPGFGQPKPLVDGTVALTVPQAQATIQAEEIAIKSTADLTDMRTMYGLQGQANTSLSNDLSGCQANNVEASKVIAQYKKAAVKSKFKRFIEGAEKAGLFIGGFYLGHKL